MFDISLDKIIVIMIIAAFLVGPSRLPALAEKLARLTVSARRLMVSTRDRLRDEVGDEIDDIDWKKLNPRNYDPRQIIRRALEVPYDEAAAGTGPQTVKEPRSRLTEPDSTDKAEDEQRKGAIGRGRGDQPQ